MPRRAATFPGVTAFDRRVTADYRRAVCRTVGIGVGTVTTAGTIAGTAAVAAAWMVSTALNGAPHFKTTPLALEMAALSQTGSERIITAFADLAAASRSNDAVASAPSAAEARDADAGLHPLPRPRAEPSGQAQYAAAAQPAKPAWPLAAAAPPSGRVAAALNMFDPEPLSGAAPLAAPARTAPLPPAQVAERTDAAPAPRRLEAPPNPAPRDTAAPPAQPAPPPVAAATSAPSLAPRTWLARLFAPQPPHEVSGVAPDRHTAIYDIVAHTVYMPDGIKLEAHSGLGGSMDDPHAVRERARGPTPPNVYHLALRDGLFHGVRAIRMNPVDDAKMFGRAGILAHPYMLGPSGQSFGCVSFKNYAEFLQAFEQGKVERMIVVTHLPDRDERRFAVNEP